MLENLDELLERYFDERLAALAVKGLCTHCHASAALYDPGGKRLWHSGDTPCLLEPSGIEDLRGVFEECRSQRAAIMRAPHTAALVCAPVDILEGTIGFLVVWPELQEGDKEPALERFAELTAMCAIFLAETLIGRRTGADLAAELTERYEELSLVYTLTQALDISKSEHEALDIICNAVAETLAADLLILIVPTLGYRIFYPPDTGGSPPDALADALFEELRHLPRTTAANYLEQNEKYAQVCQRYAHVACVPLDVDGEFGMLALLRGDFEDRLYMGHVKMLEAVSRQLSIFLTNRKITAARTQLFDLTIFGLARLAESRDTETGEHLERVSSYCRVLAEHCRVNGIYPEVVDEAFVETIFRSSPLHDIGKVGIPDAILNKPGKLTPEEFDLMKQHSVIGGDTLHDIELRLNWGESNFLTMGRMIAYSHHEKWNGAGYPDGLSGEDIPLPARIMAVADVYDALTSKRCYKDAMPHEKARQIIDEGRGAHFDPQLVDAFLQCEPEFLEVMNNFHAGTAAVLEQERFLKHFKTEPRRAPEAAL